MGKTFRSADEYVTNLLNNGSKVPVDIDGSYEMQLPDWADESKIKKAQKLFSDHYFSMMNACFMGLLAILAIPTILNVLIFTNKSSTTYTAYKRYIQTIFHMLSWFREDLKPGTKAWKSLEAVRKFHFNASKSAENKQVGMIMQKDMAITQFGFMGFSVLTAKKMGIFTSRNNLEAFCHFWRVIASLIGIHDEFNLCADNYEETIERLKIIKEDVLGPAVNNPPRQFPEMSRYVVDGLWCFNPNAEYDSLMFLIKRLLDIPRYHFFAHEARLVEPSDSKFESQTWKAKWMIYVHIIIFEYLFKIAIVRWYINFQTVFSEYLLRYFPFLAFYSFGVKKSYVRILKEKNHVN